MPDIMTYIIMYVDCNVHVRRPISYTVDSSCVCTVTECECNY